MKSLFSIICDWLGNRDKGAGWYSVAYDNSALGGSISFGRGATEWPGHGYLYVDPDSIAVYRKTYFNTNAYQRHVILYAADPNFFELLTKQVELIERDVPL